MPFKKGDSGNPYGRTPGSRNEINIVYEAVIESLLTIGSSGMIDRMNKLNDKSYCEMYIKLLSIIQTDSGSYKQAKAIVTRLKKACKE